MQGLNYSIRTITVSVILSTPCIFAFSRKFDAVRKQAATFHCLCLMPRVVRVPLLDSTCYLTIIIQDVRLI